MTLANLEMDHAAASCRPRAQMLARITLALVLWAGGGCATAPPTDTGPLFYPPPPQQPRIQFFTKFADATDLEGAPSPLLTFLVGDTSSERRMRKPAAVASHGARLYVADPGWDTVLVLDLVEHSFDSIHDRGEGKLQVPIAIAVDAEGNKFIADTGRKQIVQFNARDEFVRAYGDPGELIPTGVAVDERHLYVSNRREHRVEVYDRRSRRRLRSVGEFGKREGQFNRPTSLSLDARGHLFVTDSANFRIQEFDPSGEFVKSFGFLGDGPGTFARPKGSAVDDAGHLYVVDAAFENAQIWDVESAQVLLSFGGPGVRPGNMYLPASIWLSRELVPYFESYVAPGFSLDYVVLVASNYGVNKVGVYGFVIADDPSHYEQFVSPEDE